MLVQWTRNGKREVESPIRPYCFVRGKDKLGFKHAIDGRSVSKVTFRNPGEVGAFKQSIETFEADIPFIRRVMVDLEMEIEDVPICYLDIETDDSHGFPNPARDQIICIGLAWDDGRKEFLYLEDFFSDEEKVVKQIQIKDYVYVDAERAMLAKLIKLLQNTGAVVTWNGGETPYERRAFDIGYIANRWAILNGKSLHDFDYLLRHCRFFDLYQIYKFEHARIGRSLKGGYGLDNVSKHELGVGKVKTTKPFHQLSKKDLYNYCLDNGKGSGDVMLTKRLAEHTHLIEIKVALAQMTNTLLVAWNYHKQERQDELRPLILVDQLVLKKAREMKLVMPNRMFIEDEFNVEGALVIEPEVGLHQGVQNFDVKQMYPSIIINEQISPDKHKKLVPAILKPLMEKRAKYKAQYEKTKNLNDYILQYNYKVLANIFYGAFANKSSRIASAELANRITGKGRELLKQIMKISRLEGFSSLYGDTDSLFVKIEQSKSKKLQELVNDAIFPYAIGLGDYYQSILFMGDWADTNKQKLIGLKKRYIYMDEEGEVDTRGTEIINSGYCHFARTTIHELAKLVLSGATYEDVMNYLREQKEFLYQGKYDDQLVITKNVKDIGSYKFKQTKSGKEHQTQPHIRAYKKWLSAGGSNLFEISFYYTVNDVEPWAYGQSAPKDINYDFYWIKQVLNPVDTIIRSAYRRDIQFPKVKIYKKIAKGQQTMTAYVK